VSRPIELTAGDVQRGYVALVAEVGPQKADAFLRMLAAKLGRDDMVAIREALRETLGPEKVNPFLHVVADAAAAIPTESVATPVVARSYDAPRTWTVQPGAFRRPPPSPFSGLESFAEELGRAMVRNPKAAAVGIVAAGTIIGTVVRGWFDRQGVEQTHERVAAPFPSADPSPFTEPASAPALDGAPAPTAPVSAAPTEQPPGSAFWREVNPF
jgi:hypothetical protein